MSSALPSSRLSMMRRRRSGAREAATQGFERVGGIGAAELGLDAGDPNAVLTGRDFARLGEAVGEGSHTGGRLQRVLRRNEPPDLVEAETLQRQPADMQMAAMGRVERAAEKADAPAASGVEAPSRRVAHTHLTLPPLTQRAPPSPPCR